VFPNLYMKFEGSRRQEDYLRSRHSRVAEPHGNGATTSTLLRSGKSTMMGQEVLPFRGCGWQAPPPSKLPPTQSSSKVDRRQRVVFSKSHDMVVFLKGSVPAAIFLLGRPALSSKIRTTKLKLRSCRKSSSSNLNVMASCAVTTHPFVQGNLPTMSRISQEQSEEIPWQAMKGKY
jgi:hypothetical protein